MRPRQRIRSAAQNRYLWHVVYGTILSHARRQGFTLRNGSLADAESVHRWAKETFAAEAIKLDAAETGRTVEDGELVRPSTSTMTTGAMQFYVRLLQERFAQLGIDIPDANEEELTAVYGKKIRRTSRA